MKLRPTQFRDWFERAVQEAGSVAELARQRNIPAQTLYKLYKKDGFPGAVTLDKLGVKLEVPKA